MVEVAIALVIVSVVVISTVGLLAPVQQNIEDVVSADEISRLRRAVEIEMSILRPSESYKSAFDKAYMTVKNDDVVCAFFYRADVPTSSAALNEGRTAPVSGNFAEQRLGVDYVQQAAVFTEEKFGEARSDGFFDAAEGRVFLVRFKLLESILINMNEIEFSPPPITLPIDSNDFTEAVLPVAAEFYTLESIDLVANAGASAALDKFVADVKAGDLRPVFELNMAFNR